MTDHLYDRRLSTGELLDMTLLTTRIKDAVDRFSSGGWVDGVEYPARWPELEGYLSESRSRYHSAKIGDVEVNAGTLAGRVMITFQCGDAQVTVVGEEGAPQKRCGLHTIEASVNEIVGIMDSVIAEWDIKAFKPNPKAIIV